MSNNYLVGLGLLATTRNNYDNKIEKQSIPMYELKNKINLISQCYFRGFSIPRPRRRLAAQGHEKYQNKIDSGGGRIKIRVDAEVLVQNYAASLVQLF